MNAMLALKPIPRTEQGPSPSAAPAQPAQRKLGELLVERGVLSAPAIAKVLAFQTDRGLAFGEAAIRAGLARREDVWRVLAEQQNLQMTDARGAAVAPKLIAARTPFDPAVEAFRQIRADLRLAMQARPRPVRTIAVVSASPADGRSLLAANLAVVMAQAGQSVCLVDADLRRPSQHVLFGLKQLEQSAAGQSGFQAIEVPWLPTLTVATTGHALPRPVDALSHPAFNELLASQAARHDVVLVDTSAASNGADARLVASACNAAFLVGRRGTTDLRRLVAFRHALQTQGTDLLGAVLNDH